MRRLTQLAFKGLSAGIGLAAASYASYIGIAWARYGQVALPSGAEEDFLLDQFMPDYEVAERHSIDVGAPAEVTFQTACEMDLQDSIIIKGIFRARELLLGSQLQERSLPSGLLAQTRELGWGVLGEVANREIVMGAVTQPWLPDVEFRALPPHEFATFKEPGYVKIAWTLRADPVDAGNSIFRTETRAVATDPVSRAKFRWYWAKVSPGIRLIRKMTLGPLRREAELRARYT